MTVSARSSSSSGSDAVGHIEKWRDRINFAVVVVCAFATPLVFVRDPVNMFALPKNLFLRLEAIVLVALHLSVVVLRGSRPRFERRAPWVLAGGSVVVIGILALLTTNVLLSRDAFVAAVSAAIVFVATAAAAARSRSHWLVSAPLGAALINAVLVVIEELNIWMPFGRDPQIAHHLQCTALIGNPNEVGSFLGVAVLASAIAAGVLVKVPRWHTVTLASAAVLLAGLVASQTLTAMAACAAAIVVSFARRGARSFLRAVASLAAVAVVAVILITPLRTRAENVVEWIRQGNFDSLSTNRLTPFASAWRMFQDHPWTGVGPGAFAWHYFDYKLEVEREHPNLRASYNRGLNYGDVHSDHLQVLAEGGIVGYAWFIAVIAYVAALSFNARDPGDRFGAFATTLALPLVVYLAVVAIAQFPLESPAVRSLILHLAAICVVWRAR